MLRSTAAAADEGGSRFELMVVVAIIAVLGGLAFLVVPRFMDNSDVRSCEQDRRNIERAVDSYEGDSTYPPTLDELRQDIGADGIVGNRLIRARYTLTYDPETGAVTTCPTDTTGRGASVSTTQVTVTSVTGASQAYLLPTPTN